MYRMENLDEHVSFIFEEVKVLVNESKKKRYSVVNTGMLNLYQSIGKIIIEIQQGDGRATYGEVILEKLSQKIN